MAKKTQAQIAAELRKKIEAEVRSELEAALLDPAEQEEQEYADFLSNMGTSIAKVFIYRIPKAGGGGMQFVDEVGMEAVTESSIKEIYGGGKYLLKFRDSNNHWRGNRNIEIAGPSKDPGTTTVSPGSVPTNENFFTAQITMIQANADRQHEMLLKLIETMGKGTAAPAVSMKDMAETMAILKGLSGGDKDAIGELRKVLALSKELAPGEHTEESFTSVAKQVAGKVLEHFSAPPNPQQNPNGRHQASVVDISTKAPMSEQQQADKNMQDWLTAQIAFLKQKAKQGRDKQDPDSWIDYMFENDDEPGCVAVLSAVSQGIPFEALLQFDPEIGQDAALKSWFQSLYDGIREELSKSHVDPSRPSGDAGDPAGHAESSVGGSAKS